MKVITPSHVFGWAVLSMVAVFAAVSIWETSVVTAVYLLVLNAGYVMGDVLNSYQRAYIKVLEEERKS